MARAPDEPTEDSALRVSKTKRKQAMHELQALGERLVELSVDRLEQLPLPEALREAVREATRVHGREARRRQLQYIGRLMRDVDPEPLRSKLDAWFGQSQEEARLHHAVERWRTRLLEEDGALTAFIERHPTGDVQELRALLRDVRREQREDKPPRHYRDLYRAIRAIVVAGEAPKDGASI